MVAVLSIPNVYVTMKWEGDSEVEDLSGFGGSYKKLKGDVTEALPVRRNFKIKAMGGKGGANDLVGKDT